MKLLAFLFVLVSGFPASASEVNPAVKELNTTIDQILNEIRDTETVANIEFLDIQTDEQRALALSLKAHFRKTGPDNFFELKIDDLSYTYGDGSAPVTRIKGSIGTDFTTLLGQEQINKIIPEVEALIGSFAADATKQFGEAVTVQVEITSRTQDKDGNYTGITGRIVGQVDLSKLPESVKSESVALTSFDATLSADVKTGLAIDATLVSNPGFSGFQRENEGLKDVLDRLLAQDQNTISGLRKFIVDLNHLARLVAHRQGF